MMDSGSVSKMAVTYLGTNTLAIKKGTADLLIDPHFSRPDFLQLLSVQPDFKRIAEGLQMGGISQLAAVLLTHTHYDHALDLPAIIRTAGGAVFGSESARQILLGSGLPEWCFHPVKVGGAAQVGPFTVCFHPAQHIPFPLPLRWMLPESGKVTAPLTPPAPFWAYRCGEVYALQVDRTLIFGSAGFEPGAYAGLDPDALILGIGGLETKPDSYLQQLYHETVIATGVKYVWLSHWDNFFRPLSRDSQHLIFSGRTVQRLKARGKRMDRP
jgi:hypothetical protein